MRTITAAVMWLPITLAACAPSGPDNDDPERLRQERSKGLLVADQAAIAFPPTVPGEIRSVTLELTNSGEGGLTVQGVDLSGSSAFALADDSTPFTLEPGSSRTLAVTYRAQNEPAEGSLMLVSDGEHGAVRITLSGDVAEGELAFAERTGAMGAVPLGCSSVLTHSLVNTGDAPLQLLSLDLDGRAFSIPQGPALPLELGAGEGLSVPIAFAPGEAGAHTATLNAQVEGAGGPVSLALRGVGDDRGICLQLPSDGQATVAYGGTAAIRVADIALLVDTSGSMNPLLSALVADFAGLTRALDGSLTDASWGVASFEDYNYWDMGSGVDTPFRLGLEQRRSPILAQSALNGLSLNSGDDTPESALEALFQAVSGTGYDQDCDAQLDEYTDVLPYLASSRDPFGGAEGGHASERRIGDLGGMGFRDEVLPVIILATDTAWRDPDVGDRTPDGCPGQAGRDSTVEALASLGARFVGVGAGVAPDDPLLAQMDDVAKESGALADLDGDGEDEPVVVAWHERGSGLDELLSEAVLSLVDGAVFSAVWLEADPPPGVGVDVSMLPERLGPTRPSDELDIELRASLSEGAPRAVEVPLRLMGVLGEHPIVLHERTLWIERVD